MSRALWPRTRTVATAEARRAARFTIIECSASLGEVRDGFSGYENGTYQVYVVGGRVESARCADEVVWAEPLEQMLEDSSRTASNATIRPHTIGHSAKYTGKKVRTTVFWVVDHESDVRFAFCPVEHVVPRCSVNPSSLPAHRYVTFLYLVLQ